MSDFPENRLLAYGLAIGLAVVALAVIAGAIYLADSVLSDDEPEPTLTEFSARILAKSEYSRMDPTAAPAECEATEYREDDDTWEIECTLEQEDGTEITRWEVRPDGQAALLETTEGGKPESPSEP